MALLRYWSALSLRRNRRELVGIVVLLGVLGGISLFALAGARRTQSAYPRFLRAADASTMAVDPGQYDAALNAAIAARPEVLRSTTYVAFNTTAMVDDQPDFDQDFEALGTFDGRFFTMDRFTATRGRAADPDRADEIVVNEAAADRYGYRVGQQLDLGTFSNEQVDSFSEGDALPTPVNRAMVTIVGVGLFTDEIVQDDTNRLALVLLTPAFSRELAAYASYAWQGLVLRNGDADVPALKAWYVDRLEPGSPQFFRVTSVDTFHALQAVLPLSLALGFFGAITFGATLVLVGQAVNRRLRLGRSDRAVLFAMGAPSRALALAGFGGPVLAVGAGAILAALLAWLASPLMPIGAVRRVEVDRGFDADWTVLLAGVAVLVIVLSATAAFTSWRTLPGRRTGHSVIRRSRLVDSAARAGMSPAAVTGLRRAFEPGDGATAVPVRSVIVASIISIVTIVAALTFGASFRELLRSPALYGWNWDATIFDSSGYGSIDLTKAQPVFDAEPGVEAWSGAYFGADSIDGSNVPLMGMEAGSAVSPPLLSGRMIASADEVVLGPATSSSLGKHVGDTVQIGVGTDLTTLRIVGIATFPTVGIVHGAHTSLGVGAIVVPDLVPGFNRQAPQDSSTDPASDDAGSLPGPPAVFVRYAPGADRSAARAAVEHVAASFAQYEGSAYVIAPQRPAEIVNSSSIGSTPALLASMLGVATAISLAVALAASVTRRRNEFALLQSIGFTRGQLTMSVMWQATATIAVGLIIGIPLGIVSGRLLWSAFAQQLDVVRTTSVPVLPLVAVAAIALVVANVAAVLPARIARRVQPATALRSE